MLSIVNIENSFKNIKWLRFLPYSVVFITLFFRCNVILAHTKHLNFDHITITDGLPHNTVYCLLEDNYGFIWAGTQDGLIRYDGYKCMVFKQTDDNSNKFQGKSIQSLLEDSKGNLWVGTQTNGINFRSKHSGVFYNLKDNHVFEPISKKWISCLFEDKTGKIWIGTIGAGLWCYSPKYNQLLHFDKSNSELQDDNISSVCQDDSGRIWIGASGKGIYYLDKKGKKIRPFHVSGSEDTDFASFKKKFHLDNRGNLWVATEGSGLYQINLSTLKTRRFSISNGLTSNNIMSLTQNKYGELILATDGGGLNILDPTSKSITSYRYGTKQGNLNSDALLSLLTDQDDNLWIGTFNGGINVAKTHKTYFENFTQTGTAKSEISHRSVLSIFQDTKGRIYLGTDGGGLNTFDRINKSFSEISNDPIGNGKVVKSIFEDSKKNLWLGYFENGLSILDRKSKKFRHFKYNPSDTTSIGQNNVWSVIEDNNKIIWIGTLGGGLARLENLEKGIFKRFNHHPENSWSISSNDIIVVFADRNGQIWVGTDTEGLNLFDKKSEKFTRYKHQKGSNTSISANDIRSIFQDSKGRLWIGTESGGLNLWLGNGKFKNYTTKNGLISNAIMHILEDKNGNLWLSTFLGVSRFSVESGECLNYYFNKNSQINPNQFNQASGICDSDGTILFGGINGLTVINPNEVKFLTRKPSIVLTDFKILDQSPGNRNSTNGPSFLEKNLQELSEINLSHKDNVFSIEFAAIDYTDPYKNQYLYKLDGFDKNWQSTNGEQRLVSYSNLEPKTYIFMVKGSNNNGVWSDEKNIKIIITPPFWKTGWFKITCCLIILGVTWRALRFYINQSKIVFRQKVLEYDHSIISLNNKNLHAEKIILQLQKEKLSHEINIKNLELVTKAIQMVHKKGVMENLTEQLEVIKKAKDSDKNKLLNNLKSKLTAEINGEDGWSQFLYYFDQVNQNFTNELLKRHPNLTLSDLRMCALTRLNLSNKEKAALLNITVTGVEKSRYRLKKRLELDAEIDLVDYLRQY
jgi:ligand-binding sensor domain-containing protein